MPIGLQVVLLLFLVIIIVTLTVCVFGVLSAVAMMCHAIRRYYDVKTEILRVSSWEKGKLTHL